MKWFTNAQCIPLGPATDQKSLRRIHIELLEEKLPDIEWKYNFFFCKQILIMVLVIYLNTMIKILTIPDMECIFMHARVIEYQVANLSKQVENKME